MMTQPSSRLTLMLSRMNALLRDAASWASVVRPASVIDGTQWARGVKEAPLGVLDRVYANSTVDMGEIDVIGFDYDHTMVNYRKQLNARIYSLALQRLTALGYPDMTECCTAFDPESVIRGLAVDKRTGALVKLSYGSRIVQARRGHQWLSDEEIASLFGVDGALPAPLRDARLLPLNDLYALATGSLLSDVIEFHEHVDRESVSRTYNPRCVVADVMSAIADVHTSFAIHREVLESLPSQQLVEPVSDARSLHGVSPPGHTRAHTHRAHAHQPRYPTCAACCSAFAPPTSDSSS